jgi:hypothetical protein
VSRGGDRLSHIDAHRRLRILEDAASELLESERNASLLLGVSGSDCAPLVVTAMGCSLHVAFGPRTSVLIDIASLHRSGAQGPRAIAEGCDRTLRTIHHLAADFVPTLCFDDPLNTVRFLGRLG